MPVWEKHWNSALARYLKRKEKLLEKQEIECNVKDEAVQFVGRKEPKAPAKPSIIWALFKCFHMLVIPATIFKTIADLLQFLNPQILKYLLFFGVNYYGVTVDKV